MLAARRARADTGLPPPFVNVSAVWPAPEIHRLNAATLAAIVFVVFALGYHFYSGFLARTIFWPLSAANTLASTTASSRAWWERPASIPNRAAKSPKSGPAELDRFQRSTC